MFFFYFLDEFPEIIRDWIQQDYKGRFYEDFYRFCIFFFFWFLSFKTYFNFSFFFLMPMFLQNFIFPFSNRIVVQNERYEDWASTLIQLRVIFNEYPQKVVRYHEACGLTMPPAENSTASQGNFLETLNMSLNCKYSPISLSSVIVICSRRFTRESYIVS